MKLLVIGNGFDLALGTESKYSHYFKSPEYSNTKDKAFNWINACEKALASHHAKMSINMHDYDFNCWDLLFCLESYRPALTKKDLSKIEWCDIEEVIHKSLSKATSPTFSWNNVRQLLSQPELTLANSTPKEEAETIMAW